MRFLPLLLVVSAIGCSGSEAPSGSAQPSGSAPQAQSQPAETKPQAYVPASMSADRIKEAKAAAELANKKNAEIEKEASQGN